MNLDFSKIRAHTNTKTILYLIALPIICITVFYFYYAFHAWFFQDDFTLLSQYSNQLDLNEIRDLQDNFGRFLSRNFYWFSLHQVLGHNAALYFIFNFGLVLANTCLLFKLIQHHSSNCDHSKVIAAIYFCAAPIIANYAWLANSQHLMAHFFVFLYLYFISANSNSPSKIIQIFIIFILGIYSNVLMIFVLPLHFMLEIKTLLKNKMLIIYFLITGTITLAFLMILNEIGEAYSSVYTLSQLTGNIAYYAHALYGPYQLLYVLIFFVLTAYLGALFFHVENKKRSLLFLFATILFYAPFMFLEHQHYLNYIALSYTFFWATLLIIVRNRLTLLFLFSLATVPSIGLIKHYIKEPKGAHTKHLIYEINNTFGAHEPVVLCLSPENQQDNITDVSAWNIPPIWWFLGFGEANKLFNHPNITVLLLQDNLASCDFIWTLHANLHIKHKSERLK